MYAELNPYLPALKTARVPQQVGAILAIALHVTAVAAALSYAPTRSALLAAAPIMVEWISPAKPNASKRLSSPEPVTEPKPREAEAAAVAPVQNAPAPAEKAVTPKPPEPPAMVAAAAALVPVTQPVFSAEYLENQAPPYPLLSRRMHEEGRVLLRVLVGSGGRADEVQVQSSSGFARLDDAARETVRQWKFLPAKRGSDPVAAWVLIPVSFSLEG